MWKKCFINENNLLVKVSNTFRLLMEMGGEMTKYRVSCLQLKMGFWTFTFAVDKSLTSFALYFVDENNIQIMISFKELVSKQTPFLAVKVFHPQNICHHIRITASFPWNFTKEKLTSLKNLHDLFLFNFYFLNNN